MFSVDWMVLLVNVPGMHVLHPSPLDDPLSMHALIMWKSLYHHSMLPIGATSLYWYQSDQCML